jgi:quercetin dioxygenase-like cupin family protein
MSQPTYHKWTDLPQTSMAPKIKRRLVSGEKVMVVQVTLEQGAVVPAHHHPHEQMSHILSGQLEFEINGAKRVVIEGEIVYLPSNVPHGVVALVNSVVLDIFSPPREDFLT